MSIGDSRTVWILGAGFSKSLGGPLLLDLFRQQTLVDLVKFMGRDLANDLTWVQALFNHGQNTERLWENAEDFLAYVDSAYRDDGSHDHGRKAILEGVFGRAGYPYRPSGKIDRPLNDGIFAECVRTPGRAVRRALAAESSLFLSELASTDERWKPYREWARTLHGDRDAILTFNYDTVLEKLDPDRFEILLPHNLAVRGDRVPVIKLHGSWNWLWDERTKSISVNDETLNANLSIAIAAPGRSKAESVESRFRLLWQQALLRLKQANSIVILGYGFPKTDAEARMELLGGIEEAPGGQVKQVEIVLGPDTNRSESRRVLELVRHRTGHRRVFVDKEPEHLYTRGEKISIVTQHPLWAEDFIGDYSKRTERTQQYPVKEQPPVGY